MKTPEITISKEKKQKEKKGKRIECSDSFCTADFRESNLYLVRVMVGDIKLVYCNIKHFNQMGKSNSYDQLVMIEMQDRNKDKFKSLPEVFKCGATGRCTKTCNTFVNIQVGPTDYINFCLSSCLVYFLSRLALNRYQKLIKFDKRKK